ncbi:ATP-binding cassette domain-containing protein [Hydrogenophaga intermedia]|uniref:ATP-binding cassette domain-containing protein n=1 Tax=Hydrogenophaga intermedia TaxID=65786 RepID=UPI00204311F5|nr:ATP-binding cassette domain-containing protein [Hydrogenophaga intermedia]MCM3565131.1 ATP-binding cassette domain-containing protein [Hydrogenophaga intermedia]
MTLTVHLERLGTPERSFLQSLHLSVKPGEILTLMGPSGCGKSSLLAAIAGTLGEGIRFDGSVHLDGEPIDQLPTHRRGVGLLFQDDLLFAHMSVAENLLFALPAGPRAPRDAAVQAALAEAGLQGLGERDPATLSGGQRARVALMRALLARPRALLLDEPFSRLDAALREQVRGFVFEHARQRAIPVLLVTHERDDIADPARVIDLGQHA